MYYTIANINYSFYKDCFRMTLFICRVKCPYAEHVIQILPLYQCSLETRYTDNFEGTHCFTYTLTNGECSSGSRLVYTLLILINDSIIKSYTQLKMVRQSYTMASHISSNTKKTKNDSSITDASLV